MVFIELSPDLINFEAPIKKMWKQSFQQIETKEYQG